MISFKCDTCANSIHVPDEAAGKTGTCKKCGNRLHIPGNRLPPTPDQIASKPRPSIPPRPDLINACRQTLLSQSGTSTKIIATVVGLSLLIGMIVYARSVHIRNAKKASLRAEIAQLQADIERLERKQKDDELKHERTISDLHTQFKTTESTQEKARAQYLMSNESKTYFPKVVRDQDELFELKQKLLWAKDDLDKLERHR